MVFWLTIIREFFILCLPFLDDAVIASDSEKYLWFSAGLLLSNISS